MLDVAHTAMDRRRLLTGGLLAAAAPFVFSTGARAGSGSAYNGPKPTNVAAWTGYDSRLRARLADAGGGAFEISFARDLLPQVNELRKARGLGALRWDEGLAACARAHAGDMAGRNYFAHQSPEGFTHMDRAALLTRDLCGGMTENLAWRRQGGATATPRDIELLWEGSLGHRDNLLDPTVSYAGYGVVRLNNAYFAVGLYSDAEIRLAAPMPLALRAGGSLQSALVGASPHIERVTLTHPGREPTRLAPRLEEAAPLQPGVWRLRPMISHGTDTFNVLSGPIIFVA